MPPIGKEVAVVREVVIAASPETIWQFLVDPTKAVRWMGVAASFDVRAGGRYRVEVLPGDAVLGEFVELDRPRRLVQTWGWESAPDRCRRARRPSHSTWSSERTARSCG